MENGKLKIEDLWKGKFSVLIVFSPNLIVLK